MSSAGHPAGTQAPWLPIYAILTGVIVVMLSRFGLAPGVIWWQMPVAGLLGAAVAFMLTLFQQAHRGSDDHEWIRVLLHRIVTLLGAAAWTTWALLAGPTALVALAGVGGTAALASLGLVCQSPPTPARPQPAVPEPTGDRRHPVIQRWERIIRQVTTWPVVVVGWEPWENSTDGLRLYVELPADKGTTAADLAGRAENLAAAARLPVGCAVRVLDHERQGVVVVDVMLRNSLVDLTDVHTEPTTPASLTDSFPVLTTPRGERLSICLRIFSMVVGGTVGSGKTTLLHRIIMFLARCTDTLIWIIDLNGGGVAEPWINPWANGRAQKPVVDWVADNEPEAAAMVAAARAVAVDRKTNREAARRMRAANSTVLPLDANMPGIVVLTDEGGELRQAASLFGQLAEQGTARLAQIGRAVGVRLIMSVLRGTSDLTNKAFRVVATIRLCLRMEEQDEYSHVLASNPGKVDLGGALGAGYLRTAEISRPVLGRTVNVDLAGIDRHAVACGGLRPDLDGWGLAAAAKVTPRDILDGRQPAREHMAFRVMQDAANGRVYTDRWDRYAAKLAQMRGEEYDVDEPAAPPVAELPAGPSQTSALDTLEAKVLGAADVHAKVIHLFPGGAQQTAGPADATPAQDTAREQIVKAIKAGGPDGVTAADLERQVTAARSRMYALLKDLREAGEITQNDDGRYVLPAFVASAG